MWNDAQGHEWYTVINVTTVRRVKDMTDILLTDAADTDLVQRLYSDMMLLADVLAAVCAPQINERDLSTSDFGELLIGDIIDVACESLMRDISLFFPPSRRRVVEKFWTTARKLETEKVGLIERKLSKQMLDKLISQAVAKASTEIDNHLVRLGDDSGKLLE